ncbi:PKD domain-containing protein [Parafrankia sp. FMc2]|uniref:PKD domain-containing protein n=1 Tax=Parafrankia sp. FMc2 TaxID=3233196 RepID=UPI0034D558D4
MTRQEKGIRDMRHPNRGPLRAGLLPRGRLLLLLRLTVALGLVACGFAVVSRGDGVSARQLSAEDGAAWLVSSATGQAALVDGASSQVVARVAVGTGELSSAQAGPNAYVVNSTAGSVLRVDGATFAPTDPVRFGTSTAARQLQVFPTKQAAFVVDGQSGLVTTADPDTLQARGLQSIAARTGAGGVVADDAGRLWLIDRAGGGIVRLDERGRKVRAAATASDGGRLVLVAGRPTVVDAAARTVLPLDDDGTPGTRTCLDTLPADDSVAVLGDQSRPRVYAVSGQRGTLVITDLATGSCDTVLDLAAAGHALGQPRQAAGRVFIPDFTDGRVIVLDAADRRIVARPEVLPAGTRFELVAQGPYMFFNDPGSFRAGAIRLDGSVRVIEKYNPDRPGAGLTGGAGNGETDQPRNDNGMQNVAAPLPPTAPAPRVTRPKTVPPAAPVGNTGVAIQVSAARAGVGRPVTLRLVARDGTRIAGATWAFGDGTTGGGAQASHAWSQPGAYLVIAHATLADGRHAAPAVRITVDQTAPPPVPGTGVDVQPGGPDSGSTGALVARLTVTPASGAAPLQVTADATGSTAGTAPITGYAFDFGDGTTTGGPGAASSATHTYEAGAAGTTFTVSATVTDEAGNISRASQPVTITDTGGPAVPTMTVAAGGDRWRVTAQAGTGGAPTTRFALTADLPDVTVTPVSDTAFDVIPASCAAFTVTLTAYADDGSSTPSAPRPLDPQADGLSCPFPPPEPVVKPAEGFGFTVAVTNPAPAGSVSYEWSYTAEGGDGGGLGVETAGDQIHFRTPDCRLITVTVTATGPSGSATSEPVTGMGCTVPEPIVLTRTVVGTRITWTWTLPSNTHVETYFVSHSYPGAGGEDGDGGATSDPGTSYTVDGVPGGTYGFGIIAENAAGRSSAHDEVTLPGEGTSPLPNPTDPPDLPQNPQNPDGNGDPPPGPGPTTSSSSPPPSSDPPPPPPEPEPELSTPVQDPPPAEDPPQPPPESVPEQQPPSPEPEQPPAATSG